MNRPRDGSLSSLTAVLQNVVATVRVQGIVSFRNPNFRQPIRRLLLFFFEKKKKWDASRILSQRVFFNSLEFQGRKSFTSSPLAARRPWDEKSQTVTSPKHKNGAFGTLGLDLAGPLHFRSKFQKALMSTEGLHRAKRLICSVLAKPGSSADATPAPGEQGQPRIRE